MADYTLFRREADLMDGRGQSLTFTTGEKYIAHYENDTAYTVWKYDPEHDTYDLIAEASSVQHATKVIFDDHEK